MATKILYGDMRDRLAKLPEQRAHMCVTSPPYWGLRKYAGAQELVWGGDVDCEHEWNAEIRKSAKTQHGQGKSTLTSGRDSWGDRDCGIQGAFCKLCGAWFGALGQEPTPDLYIAHLVECFQAVKRVLRDDGTLWVNIGDSSAASGCGGNPKYSSNKKQRTNVGSLTSFPRKATGIYKPKDMIGIPYMLAFAMRADGWYWRRAIIWMKAVSFCDGYNGSVMPENTTDRPTSSYEIIHLFSKKKDYVYDWFAAREDAEWNRWGAQKSDKMVGKAGLAKDRSLAEINVVLNTGSRNWRDVWALKRGGGTRFKHYAAFPLDLPFKCITAGTMPHCCAECGAPFKRIVERSAMEIERSTRCDDPSIVNRTQTSGKMTKPNQAYMLGWKSTCNHPCRTPARSVVLDPFGGTGTTAQAAEVLNRDSILIDLGSEYCDMAKERMATPWKTSPGGRKKESKLKPLF